MFTLTFYSFKGGVGRTLALMNVAVALAKKNKKVVVMDFDLEAPGLHTFNQLFPKKYKEGGILDFVKAYERSYERGDPDLFPSIQDYLVESKPIKISKKQGDPNHYSSRNLPIEEIEIIDLLDFSTGSISGNRKNEIDNAGDQNKIWLMPAKGKKSDLNVDSVNWRNLVEQKHGLEFLVELKQKIFEYTKADYLLIDSRTGYADHSYISTNFMADGIAIIFFPNEQNLDGLKEIVPEIFEASSVEKENIIFVASRIPRGDDDKGILEAKMTRFQKDLDITSDILSLSHKDDFQLLEQEIFTLKNRKNTQLYSEYMKFVLEIEEINHLSREGTVRFLNKRQLALGGPRESVNLSLARRIGGLSPFPRQLLNLPLRLALNSSYLTKRIDQASAHFSDDPLINYKISVLGLRLRNSPRSRLERSHPRSRLERSHPRSRLERSHPLSIAYFMIAFIGSNQLIKKLPQKDKDAVTSRALHLLDIAITSYQRMITIFERDRFNRMGKLSINLKTLDEITVGEFFNAFDKISDSNYRNSELNIDQVLLGTLLDEANKLYEEVMSSENLTLFSTPMEEFTRQVNIWKQRKLRTSPVITSMIRNRKRLTRDHPEEISPAGWSFSQREASLFNNKEDLLEYIYEFRRFQRLSNIGYSDMDRALVIYNYFATSSPISEEEELGIYRYLKLEGRLKELNAEPSEEDVQFDVDSLPISTEVSDGELVHILELPGDLTPRKWQCIVGLGNLVNGESEGFSGFTEFDDVFYGYGSTKLAETLISLISILKDYKTQAAYEKDKSKEAEEFLSNTKDTFLKIIKDIKFLNNELITVDGEPQDFIFSFISFRNVSFSEMIQEIREIQSMDAESILRYMRKKLLVDPPEFDSILMCD